MILVAHLYNAAGNCSMPGNSWTELDQVIKAHMAIFFAGELAGELAGEEQDIFYAIQTPPQLPCTTFRK
jgi:hypothetical protein